ncbi:MAG TPA: response regulator [Anaeromyxobacteraceae bacterium]|nr:response regulator [Anaeromyxobacteraceae bacterium]
MQKNVLLIENDAAFARAMAQALEARGFGVRTSPDGKEGFELAKALRPDCVVLCVELPGLSGYSWCNRLKKDGELKAIPLVITSAEATPETFDQHRKLKTRAEDYLLKPFPPATLVEHVGALVGLPEAPADGEEPIAVDDVVLEEPAGAEVLPGDDADLRQLDDAFDSITRADEPSSGEPPLTLLPDADEAPARSHLDREMEAALASLAREAAEVSKAPPPGTRAAGRTPPPSPVAAVEVVDDETPILLEDVEVLPAVDEGALQAARDEAALLRAELEQARAEAESLRAEAGDLRIERDQALLEGENARADAARDAGEAASLRAEGDRVRAEVERLQAEVERLRSEAADASRLASNLGEDLEGLRARLTEADTLSAARAAEILAASQRADELARAVDEARGTAEGLEASAAAAREEAEAFRAEVEAARAEAAGLRDRLAAAESALAAEREAAEGLRAASEAREADAARRLQEVESQAADAEEKAFLAEQQARAHEKLREKTRKALAAVLQVLEERAAGDDGSGAPPAP